MSRRAVSGGIGAAALLLCLLARWEWFGVSSWTGRTAEQAAPAASGVAELGPSDPHPDSPAEAGPNASPETEVGGLPETGIETYRTAHAFRERLRWLIDHADGLSLDERVEKARPLHSELDRLEQRNVLLPPQALLLRVALLRVSVADEAEFRERAAAMVDAAAQAQAQRRVAAEQKLIQAQGEYHRRAAAILQDVWTSPAFPDEPSRRRALRDRLHALRVELYPDL